MTAAAAAAAMTATTRREGNNSVLLPCPPPSPGSFDEECRALVAENLQKRGVHCHPGCNPMRCAALLR